MKKILKILSISVFTILILLYILFLFVLPKTVDLNKYKADLQNIVKEQSQLSLNFENIKLVTTPSLAVGIKADNVSLILPDNTLLFSSDSIKTAVSITGLILYQFKFSTAEMKNPFLNAEIMKNGEDYKIVKLIEDILNKNKEATFAQKNIETEKSGIDFSKFKIIIPKVILKNYKILITDTASKHYLDLHGKSIIFGYFDGKRIKLKTDSELFSDNNKNIDFKIDINTFLPQNQPKLDNEDDPAEKVDFAFVNPVKVYQNYDLKGIINTKLKINSDKNGQISSFGYFNAENLTMKLSTVQIPDSYVKLKFTGTNIETDTDLYTHENENLKINGHFSHSGANLKFKTEQIKFANLLELLQAYTDSLQIPNEFKRYKAEGSIIADCAIRTNYKKLNSQGYIKIENGGLSVANIGKILSKININILLDNDILDVGNSGLYIGKSPVKIEGLIDKKSFADIKISTENVPLPILYNAFAPKKYKNLYNFKSGNLSSSFTMQGKMREAAIKSDFILNNFDFTDKLKSLEIKNKLFKSELNYDVKKQNLTANINNDDLNFLFPQTASNIKIPKLTAEISDGNIFIKRNNIYFNDKSELFYSGNIEDYENPKNINFNLNGKLNTGDLIKFWGKDIKPFINAKGEIPLDIKLNGNNIKQTLNVQLKGDKDNYITPVDFSMLQNLDTLIQATVDFKPNRIKIKDTGLYTRASIFDENGKETVVKNKIAGMEGTIEEDTVNLLKIDVPKSLKGKIVLFPKSDFHIENTSVYIYGKTNSPLVKGVLRINDIIIPELSTNINSIDLNFKKDALNFNLNKINMLSSDMDIKGKLSLLPSPISNIYDFIIGSNEFKVEDAVKVSEKAMAYMPKNSSNTASDTQNIPVAIHNGNIAIKKLTTGNIELKNTKANLTLLKNILSIKKLSTNVFNGKTTGDIYVNLISMLINTDLKGIETDVAQMLSDSANIKDSLSGTAEYSAKLQIDGAAQTQEAQMKSLQGDIDLIIIDGQFGPFGRLENLILAENIRESQFFQTALGGIINSIATIDTTHFSELKGHLSFKDGICFISPLTSLGNVMNLYISGNFDLIKNYADMKARVKLTSIISDMLGPLNAINPVNLVNNAASLNVVTAKAFSLFCEIVSEEEMNIMPKFSNSYVDNSATKFQLGIRGDASKPLTLIKSFKWLATQMQFAKAKEFTDSLPEPEEKYENKSVQEFVHKSDEKEKKSLKNKLKNVFKKIRYNKGV